MIDQITENRFNPEKVTGKDLELIELMVGALRVLNPVEVASMQTAMVECFAELNPCMWQKLIPHNAPGVRNRWGQVSSKRGRP